LTRIEGRAYDLSKRFVEKLVHSLIKESSMAIPNRVADRLAAGLKRFQPILASARSRDVNESDTSMIVTDLLADLFGYDKYHEVTRELCIRGTFCDLATRIEGKFQMIIEVKAIGLELKDGHVKQAVDYGARGSNGSLSRTGISGRCFESFLLSRSTLSWYSISICSA
jgi:hypothetical protein